MTLGVGSKVVVTDKYPARDNLFIGKTGTIVKIDLYYIVKFDNPAVKDGRYWYESNFKREELAGIEEDVMASPADSFVIVFNNDGSVYFRIPDFDGSDWAVPKTPLSWKQAQEIAKILGPKAEASLKARQLKIQSRFQSEVNRLEILTKQAEEAKKVLQLFNEQTQN